MQLSCICQAIKRVCFSLDFSSVCFYDKIVEGSPEKSNYNYGKRPLWQWILLYIVIGTIAYGLLYYFIFAKNNNSYSTNPGQYRYPSKTQRQISNPTSTQTVHSKSTAQQQNTVTLTPSGWSPATLTIKAGQTVTWINKSGQEATVNSNPHPTHTDYPPLNLGSFANGTSLTLTFPTQGTYGYHNHFNPSQTGTIVVE